MKNIISIFIYYLPDDLTIKKYDLKKNKSLNEIKFKKEDHPESFYYSNRGVIAVNQSNIIYAYLFKRQIDIFDFRTCEKRVTISNGKKYPKPDYRSIEDPTIYYTNVYAGTRYFYVLCRENRNKTEGGEYDYVIEVFDYNGEPVIRYRFDIAPILFVVDENKGYIYGCNWKYEDYLLRYKME